VWDEGEPSAETMYSAHRLLRHPAVSAAPNVRILVCFGEYFAPMVNLEAAEWVAQEVGMDIAPLTELELHLRTELELA